MPFKNFIYRLIHWETWDWRIKYIPLVPLWVWHCIRSRSFWFFTPSNPTLLFGGFEGVSKRSIYEHLPDWSYPKSIYVSPNLSFAAAKQLVDDNFAYPLAVKPDVGRMGFMFRIINNSAELERYHNNIAVNYIIQELVQYPLEVSVFYFRFPGQEKGNISGFIRKEFLEVVGDGRSSLLQLMRSYPRIRFRLEEMEIRHKARLDTVIPKGEVFYLSYALNLSRGGKLVSLENEKDERLLKVFDDLSHYSGKLYFGRYDIKCESVEDLKSGKNFSILEFNGSGAEPHHVYGNGYSLIQACQILANHWNILYKISKQNHSSGVKYWEFSRGWQLMRNCRRYFSLLRRIDQRFPVS